MFALVRDHPVDVGHLGVRVGTDDVCSGAARAPEVPHHQVGVTVVIDTEGATVVVEGHRGARIHRLGELESDSQNVLERAGGNDLDLAADDFMRDFRHLNSSLVG